MAENQLTEISKWDFVQALVGIHEMSKAWDQKYFETYERLDAIEDNDFEVPDAVRDSMVPHAKQISKCLDEIKTIGTPVSQLLGNAKIRYLPKSANVPEGDQDYLSVEQRHFKHVKDRIDAIGFTYEEFIDGFQTAFDEADLGEPLSQETFDVAIEGSEQLIEALVVFARDFPGMISISDHADLANAIRGIDNSREFR